jgi:hypothetical protein
LMPAPPVNQMQDLANSRTSAAYFAGIKTLLIT